MTMEQIIQDLETALRASTLKLNELHEDFLFSKFTDRGYTALISQIIERNEEVLSKVSDAKKVL
jgi:hypothetical protein